MTPEEALNFITRACESVLGTKQQHVQIEKAIAILQSEILPKNVPVENVEENDDAK